MLRFLEYLRQHPIVFDPNTRRNTYDTTSEISGAHAFDVSEVADQLVLKQTISEVDGQSLKTTLTERGSELLKLIPLDSPDPDKAGWMQLDMSHYVGIVPPFKATWWEYPFHVPGYLSTGIALQDLAESLTEDLKAQGHAHLMGARIFALYEMKGKIYAVVEGLFLLASDEDGTITHYKYQSSNPNDGTEPQNIAIITIIVSLMMLNHGMVKRELIEPPPPTRQQRRYAQRTGTKILEPVRYHRLCIDLEKTASVSGGSGKGGWIVAWHHVRGHLRHLKSGKTVTVRPHTKGNPFKGIVLKDYKLNL